MTSGKLIKRIGIALIVAGLIAGVVIAGADLLNPNSSGPDGVITGIFIMLLFWAFGIPTYRSAQRNLTDTDTALTHGQRITAVVDEI